MTAVKGSDIEPPSEKNIEPNMVLKMEIDFSEDEMGNLVQENPCHIVPEESSEIVEKKDDANMKHPRVTFTEENFIIGNTLIKTEDICNDQVTEHIAPPQTCKRNTDHITVSDPKIPINFIDLERSISITIYNKDKVPQLITENKLRKNDTNQSEVKMKKSDEVVIVEQSRRKLATPLIDRPINSKRNSSHFDDRGSSKKFKDFSEPGVLDKLIDSAKVKTSSLKDYLSHQTSVRGTISNYCRDNSLALNKSEDSDEVMSQSRSFESLKALFLGLPLGDESQLKFEIPHAKYINCRRFQTPFNPNDYEQMVMSSIEHYNLCNFNILILNPFDWIVSMDIGKGSLDISTVELREKNKSFLINRIRCLLRNIRELEKKFKKYYPHLMVISLLPYPLDYANFAMGIKIFVIRSVIQYCTIMEVKKQWLGIMPEVPIISLLDISIQKEKHHASFLDGCWDLKWDFGVSSELYTDLPIEFREHFWEIAMKMFDENPKQMRLKNIATHLAICKSEACVTQPNSAFYEEKLKQFINRKSEELAEEGVNPGLYDFDLEWAYYWNNTEFPREYYKTR